VRPATLHVTVCHYVVTVSSGERPGASPSFFAQNQEVMHAMPNETLSVVRGFRLPAHTLAKLDALAKQTGRTRASMLIYLVSLAEPTGPPDVRFRAEPSSDTPPERSL
jgi:hypothetical protein